MAAGALGSMTLVDTTVWIDFFKGAETPQAKILELLIAEAQDICVCGMVVTEVLQGIRHDIQYRQIKSQFDCLLFLPMNEPMYVQSANIYRSLRKRGITIRKPIDCMIASVAITHGVPLLHSDRDFDPIEKYCGLKAVKIKGR